VACVPILQLGNLSWVIMFQPVTQKRLTNVSVVRMRKGGKRFEIACYPNMVMAYREGHVRDLDEVIQVEDVFENVSKGKLAANADLERCFGTRDRHAVLLQILLHGDLQVSDRERQYQSTRKLHEIASVVAAKTISRETKKPLPVGLIEKALREIHFAVQPNRPAKAQALEVIPLLRAQSGLDLERARLRLRIHVPSQRDAKAVKARLEPLQQGETDGAHSSSRSDSVRMKDGSAAVESESEEWLPGGALLWTVQADPGAFREIEEIVQRETNQQGIVEVASLRVLDDEDESILS
jgi:ribosome maturation protein SDO1